jgi:nucleotide-binding universal stress UspA family protein
MTNHILVPLDGSLLAEEALPTALSLTRRQGGELDLILVNEAQLGGGLEGWPWAISTARSHGDYIANQARRATMALGRTVHHAVAEGRAADEICRYVADHDVGLVVMATHGYTGVARFIGGSVADAVMRHSHVPVLLLRASTVGQRMRARSLRLENILIALDGSTESVAALEAAMALADRGVTELHLVEVVAPVSLAPLRSAHRITLVDRVETRHVVDREHERLTAVADRVAERTGCDVYPHVVVHNDPAHGILRTAHAFNASVIAMGTHGRGASRLLIGSVAERVLADDRYPMLVVRPRTTGADQGEDRHPERSEGSPPGRHTTQITGGDPSSLRSSG